ncbi:mitochondrial ribosomal subunit S27-domain-containing protein [Cristinia sonorae]|uniref:Small ribosomal subunit protein mS33 n=1 Tax=Cristinia sonorae TaxID=1940300 RepID=A0A8K0UMW8_9AGAR|nr:mitochondrial ribosomal subunit S27-domain-containing protein [Cristinia sonorae]
MATTLTKTGPWRLGLLKQLQCSIFQTSYNPTSVRTGAKYLRRRLRGPSMINYYPPTLSIAQIKRDFPDLKHLVDSKEQQRLQDVEDRKQRGKGAPKKAKSKVVGRIRNDEVLGLCSVSTSSAEDTPARSLLLDVLELPRLPALLQYWFLNDRDVLPWPRVRLELLGSPAGLPLTLTVCPKPDRRCLLPNAHVTKQHLVCAAFFSSSPCSPTTDIPAVAMPDIAGTQSPLLPIPTQSYSDSSAHTTPSIEQVTTYKYTEQLSPLEIHLDKLRIVDALTARDVAVHRLQSACASVRVKEATIQKLEREKEEMKMNLDLLERGGLGRNKDGAEVFAEQRGKLLDRISFLEATNRGLRGEVEALKAKQESISALNTPRFNEMAEQSLKGFPFIEEDSEIIAESKSPVQTPQIPATPVLPPEPTLHLTEDSMTAEDRMKARHAILADLPIPSDMPTDILVPIVIPPPFSIHDFLGTAQGDLKNQLANYRVFQESTTSWCPEREEHGYFLTPAFKCVTNPRVSTAHRWVPVDIVAKCGKSIECFYNKENKWYYAGLYKPFNLSSLSPAEYGALSSTTSQSLIKETLSGRKNTSPQNVYETAQLYTCGALRVACVGLQCVGFSENLYRALLEQAEVCGKAGRWRGAVTTGSVANTQPVGAGLGIGTVGAAWNVAANLVGSGQGSVPGIVKLPPTATGLGVENGKGGQGLSDELGIHVKSV